MAKFMVSLSAITPVLMVVIAAVTAIFGDVTGLIMAHPLKVALFLSTWSAVTGLHFSISSSTTAGA